MSIRRFRKPRTPWRAILFVSGAALLVFVRCLYPVNRTTLDPTQVSAESGQYVVDAVLDSGRIRLSRDDDLHDGHSEETVEIALLATNVEDATQVAARLRDLIGENATVDVRFDRRRISEDTKELQAYVFVGGLCLNEELVRLGLAREDTHPSDAGPMIRRIKKAEQAAREQRRGIWKSSND